jgi:hypothetical protein
MAEIFANIEVNRDSRWRVLLGLVVASLALHMIGLVSVIYVPALRDAFNIASLIAQTSVVDKPYARTEIGDEVDVVQLSTEKFHYPDGYFSLEVPPETITQTIVPPADPFAPKIISQASVSVARPRRMPSPSPAPTASPLPSPMPTASASPGIAENAASPSNEQKVADELSPEEAQKELERTAAKNNIELPEENQINKQALKDFAVYANELKNQGKLDLNKPFEVVIEAELDQNGKLKNARFTKKAGDPNLVDLFGRMVSALNDSGFLIYLKPLDKDNPGAKVVFTIKQGESEVLASVESEASSADSARLLAKGFNLALVYGAKSRSGKDEELLMRNTSVSPDGKKIVVNFTMSRESVVDLIKKQLPSS